MNWAISQNHVLLTARISYPKTESGSLLSDILEPDPQSKYFLSEKMKKSMLEHYNRHKAKGNGFGCHILEQ